MNTIIILIVIAAAGFFFLKKSKSGTKGTDFDHNTNETKIEK